MVSVPRKRISFLAGLGFSSWEPERIVDALRSIGYGGVEWTLAHFNPLKKSPGEIAHTVDITRSYGLEVSEVVVQQDFVTLDDKVRRQRVDLTKLCIEAAAATGVHVINVFTGPAPWDPGAPRLGRDISEGQAWDMVKDSFLEVLEVAEKNQVYLAVEAVFGHLCHDYYSTLELTSSLTSEYLAINMDPSHYQLYGNDIPWVVKRWGPKIKHVHLKDVVGVPGMPERQFLFPLLGEGVIDWSRFVTALYDVGYNGFMSVEFESFAYLRNILQGDPVEAARVSMRLLEKLFALS